MNILQFILDILFIILADFLAYFFRFHHFPIMDTIFLSFWPYIILIRLLYLYAKGFYKKTFRSSEQLILKLLSNVTFSTILIIALSFLNRNLSFSRLVFFYSWILTFSFLAFEKIILYLITESLKPNKKIVLIGDKKPVETFIRELKSRKKNTFTVLGTVTNQKIKNVKWFGTIQKFYSKQNSKIKTDYFVLVTENLSEKIKLKLITKFNYYHIPYLILPDFYDIIMGRIKKDKIFNSPFSVPFQEPLSLSNTFIKRLFDFIVSFFALIFFLPIFAIISILIMFESGFPIIYKQKRVGKNGKIFKIYKFRTMIHNADKKGPLITRENDNRITFLGNFLRRTSLDELPQFINVLKGEMSLVGPRPEVIPIVKKYKDWQKEVLKIKPGITGLAQISGRQELSINTKLKMDLYYIENYSFLFDLEIILKTIVVVLVGKGAF